MWEDDVATKIRLPQAKEDSKELSGEEGKLADIKTDAVLDADSGSDGLLGRPDTFVETNKGDGYDLDGALDVRGGVNTGNKLENDNDNDGIRGEKPDASAEMQVAQNTESFDWNNEFSSVEASGLVQTNEHRLAEGNDLTGATAQVDSSLVSAVELINDAMAQNLNDTNAADIENALPENVVVDTVRPEDFI
jgi:hypothetical protein